MDGFSAAAGNVTMNAYTGFNFAASASSIIGLGALLLFIGVLAYAPKLIRRLLVGYAMLVLVGIVLLFLYAMVMSAEPVLKWVWFDVLSWIGNMLIDYGVYILLSIPLAWVAGGYADKKMFEDDKQKKGVRHG
jgi:hypothetical protein